MTLEELQIKLGVDHAGVRQGMGSAVREIESGNERVHRSFLHATSEAKGFKKLLHETAAIAPGFGQAFTFAINPIAGAFLTATAAIGFFNSKIDEMKERAGFLEKGMSDPVTKVRDNLREARKSLAEFQQEQSRWLKDLHANDNTVDKKLSDRLGLLMADSNQLKKLGGNDADIERRRLQAQLALQRGAQGALGAQEGGLWQDLAGMEAKLSTSDVAQRAAKAKQLNEGEAQIQEKLQRRIADAEKDAAGGGGVVLEAFKGLFTGKTGGQLAQERDSDIEDLKKELKASKERVQKNNQTIDDESLARKGLTDAIGDTRGKITKAHEQSLKLGEDITKTTRELSFMAGGGEDREGMVFTGTGWVKDYGALAQKSEAKRLKDVLENDPAYRLAHMNDPKSAAGTKLKTPAELLQEIRDMMASPDKGIFVQGSGSQ